MKFTYYKSLFGYIQELNWGNTQIERFKVDPFMRFCFLLKMSKTLFLEIIAKD